MKIKKSSKKSSIISFIILVILICIYIFIKSPNVKSSQTPTFKEKNNINQPQSSVNKKVLDKNTEKLKIKINVGLEVLGKEYTVSVQEKSSVYDLMKILQENTETPFSFKSKEYPTLGIFVDEINGVRGGNGGYWIYYINNKEASVGVSNYILEEGDKVLWKQE